jgi:periplasmic protein TonB
MMATTVPASDFVTMRNPPTDPRTRRLRRGALLAAVALHAAVITALMVVKLPGKGPQEPVVYDLVFVPPPAPSSPASATTAAPPAEASPPVVPATPLAPPPPPPPEVAAPAPPEQMVMPLPPPARPRPAPQRPRPAESAPPQPPQSAEAPAAPLTAPAPAAPPSAASGPAMAGPTAPTAVAHPAPDPAYAAAVLSRLARYKQYPLIAREQRLQGRVVLRLAVARSGHVTATSVERSSGAEVLDDAALDMVHRADPLPPLPASFPGTVAEFRVPVDFALSQR